VKQEMVATDNASADRRLRAAGGAGPHRQLTVQESRHKLARDICHGKKRRQAQVLQSSETE
jgi:hypothetical protein